MKVKKIFALLVVFVLLVAPTSALAASTGPATCDVAIDSNPPCECCKENETGWADGQPYPGENWATYVEYEGVAKTVTLYAGQTMVAGTVSFSDPVDGMVTILISLNNRWLFNQRDENGLRTQSIHIQDYMDAPDESPVPGLFAYKFFWARGPFTTQVPLANFYGVHVSLTHFVPCPPVLATVNK